MQDDTKNLKNLPTPNKETSKFIKKKKTKRFLNKIPMAMALSIHKDNNFSTNYNSLFLII